MEIVEIAGRIAESQATWAIIALTLGAFFFRKLHADGVSRETRLITHEEQYREEVRNREAKLLEHLDRSNLLHEKTTQTLESINRSLSALEGRVDRIEKYTYKTKGE